MNSKIYSLFLLFAILSYVQCFKTGVTRQSCTNMRPEHKRPDSNWEYAPQFDQGPPFEIKVNTTKVKPGELVEVVLSSKGQYDFFKGYFMQVFEDKSFFSQIIPFPQGSWIPLGRSRTLQCHIYEDSISHTEASYKRNVTMLWKAPQAITHPFKVKATVVGNFTHYWEDIYSPTIYSTEVITIMHPPIPATTGDTSVDHEKAKQDLLDTLAKEVGADSAKELLEILKQKVDEKSKPPIVSSTTAPTKSVDALINEFKNKNPANAEKIDTVAKNPGVLDKVKNLFGGSGKTGGSGGLLSGMLGGGSGLMSMLPLLMPMMSGGGGPLSALMGGGGGSSPLSMMTSMLGGGGAGGLMSSLLGGGKPKPPSNPLSALMGGGGGASNPLASLMGGGGGASNPMAALMGGGGGGSNPLSALMGGVGGQSNPMAGLMGGFGGQPPQGQAGGGNPLDSLMSNPAVSSMLKGMTGGGGPMPSGGIGGQNLASLLGVDPNAGAPRAELAENTSGTNAKPIAFPQMIGNTMNQNSASIQGMPNNRMQMSGMPQGMNGQVNGFQNSQGMIRGQQPPFGQNQFGQTQMNGQQMPGSFGGFQQGPNGFQQQNGNMAPNNQGAFQGQSNQVMSNNQAGFQQSQNQQNQQSTVVDMNKIQSMMNGPNGDVIKSAMQDMLAGRKTADEVMALVNSHPSTGNGINQAPSGGFMNGMGGGFSNGQFNSAIQGVFNNAMPNSPGQTGSNGVVQGGFNNAMQNSPGQSGFNSGAQGGFNNGMQHSPVQNGFNGGAQGGFNNAMPNSPAQSGFNVNAQGGFNGGQSGFTGRTGTVQEHGVPNQGIGQTVNQNFNNFGQTPIGNTHATSNNQNVLPSSHSGPDPNINPAPSNTGSNGFIKMPDFTSMIGGPLKSHTSGSGASLDLGKLMDGFGKGGTSGGSTPDLSKMLENVDMSKISGMMGGIDASSIQGMLSGPQGADLMSAASALMSGGKVDDKNPLAGLLNGPQGGQIKSMAEGLMKGEGGGLAGLLGGGGGGLAGLLGGAGGGSGGLGGIMSMLG